MSLAHVFGQDLSVHYVSNYAPIVFVVADDSSVRESLDLLIRCEGWQPDGTRLFLSEVGGAGGSGTEMLAQVSVAGGETLQVQSSVPNPYLLDVSPDHGQLLVQSVLQGSSVDVPLWALPSLPAPAILSIFI